MELFAFFVGGGQTHHREIFFFLFLGRHGKKFVTTRETRFHIQKTKSKIILSAQALS